MAQTIRLGQVTSITSTATELNILDGVTATASELNHLDGVTGITLGNASETLIVDTDGSSITTTNLLAFDTANTRVDIGGDLDLNSNDITGTGNVNITGTGTFTTMTDGTVSFTAGNISGVDELRIGQTGTGLRMTNVGAFDNDGSDNFRIFSTNDLILSTNGDSGTAVTFDQTTKDATFNGAVSTASIIKSGSTGVGNIGQSDNTFNTVFATATSAQYADLAENYASDRNYDPGTVVVLGGDQEVTQCSSFADTKVAGVVSTNPAHLMNSHIQAEYPIAVALTGRVPCKVVGPVNKGDILVTSDINGHAVVCSTPITGSIVGKSIETKTSEDAGIVEVLVGRF